MKCSLLHMLMAFAAAAAISPTGSQAAKQGGNQKQQSGQPASLPSKGSATVIAPRRSFIVDPAEVNSSGVTGTRAGRATRSRSSVVQRNTAPVVPGSSLGQNSSGTFN